MTLDLSPFLLDIGTRRPIAKSKAEATLSRLTSADTSMTFIDVCWPTGERFVVGLNLEAGPRELTEAMGALRLGVHPSPRHDRLSVITARAPARRQNGSLTVRQVSIEDLNELFDVHVPKMLKQIPPFGFGTRQNVLGDTGPRRGDLCFVFDHARTDVPAIAWCLVRAAPLAALSERSP